MFFLVERLRLEILFQNDNYVFVSKPRGHHVVPHEDPTHRVHHSKVCLYSLRDQIDRYLFPIHRLDVATTGVLGFALTSAAAAAFQKNLQQGSIQKEYLALVRGWPFENPGSFITSDQWITIDIPLESDSSSALLPSQTQFQVLERFSIPAKIGKKNHDQARYSIVRAKPLTGRFHQIRRHFNRKSWPIIGDVSHGDSHHNRYFRETLGVNGLMLHAERICFFDPMSKQEIDVKSAPAKEFSEASRKLRMLHSRSETLCHSQFAKEILE